MNNAMPTIQATFNSKPTTSRARLPESAEVDSPPFVGRFLSIQPGEELIFENKGQDRDSTDFINLTNVTDGIVAFKVKTTAPEKFKVKPSYGCIEPGQSKPVEIAIPPAFLKTAQKEKFLVMSTPIPYVKDSNDLLDYWHEMQQRDGSPEELDSHRVRCSVVSKSDQSEGEYRISTDATSSIPPIVLEKLEIINAKVDRLIALQQFDKEVPLLKKQWNLIAAGIFFVIVYVGVYFFRSFL
ncbi:motile sperm domain-containing protein 2-like [Paramacrobiotus metropolitanus]|uniref:motile sperm domain-containing protein 2-like n=1 Tax=Paramacrobiotus metropolitanus TaxID=2943436 RepID=UPI002445D0AD|nr:motile sperm domain-containing protein 2-like [Paramacrobiotus metropolitanus]